MPPHLPGDGVALVGRHVGKRDAKIFFDDMPANAEHAAHERGREFRKPFARLQRQRLNEGDQDADDQIHAEINCFSPHAADCCIAGRFGGRAIGSFLRQLAIGVLCP